MGAASLRQRGAHARQGVHTLLEAPLGAPPLGFPRDKGPPCQGGNTTATAAPTKGRGGFRLGGFFLAV